SRIALHGRYASTICQQSGRRMCVKLCDTKGGQKQASRTALASVNFRVRSLSRRAVSIPQSRYRTASVSMTRQVQPWIQSDDATGRDYRALVAKNTLLY